MWKAKTRRIWENHTHCSKINVSSSTSTTPMPQNLKRNTTKVLDYCTFRNVFIALCSSVTFKINNSWVLHLKKKKVNKCNNTLKSWHTAHLPNSTKMKAQQLNMTHIHNTLTKKPVSLNGIYPIPLNKEGSAIDNIRNNFLWLLWLTKCTPGKFGKCHLQNSRAVILLVLCAFHCESTSRIIKKRQKSLASR